jgi:hypothetical protein
MYQKIIVVLLIILLIFFISNDDKMNKYSQNKNFQYLFLIFMIFCLYNNVNVLFLIIIFLIFIYFNTNLKHKLKNNKIISNFYNGSLFETFVENFDNGSDNVPDNAYEIEPYIQENNNDEKEEVLKNQKENDSDNNSVSSNNSTLNDKKEIIEPFKLSVKEIKELYDNIKLEINKLD